MRSPDNRCDHGSARVRICLTAGHVCLVLMLTLAPTRAQQYSLAISEFMAVNAECCADAFGEFDDWVEVHNHGDEAVDIGGCT